MSTGPFNPSTTGMRPAYSVLSILSSLSVIGALALVGLGAAHSSFRTFATGDAVLLFATVTYSSMVAVGLVWLHRSWSVIPTELRGGRNPTEVFLLLVPGYNLYWMFAYNHALARATARAVGRPMPPSVANAATFAGILQLVPLLNVLVAPFAWVRFMRQVDSLRS